ncbi:MAG: ABC transporter permease [Leptospiraceae bacterium]|nr:ABC transporter permease [Leptospiraceae bacterium]
MNWRVLFIIIFLIGIFYGRPITVNLDESMLPPFQSLSAPIGTDKLGRNLLSLFSYGILTAALVAIPSRIITIFFAAILSFLGFSTSVYIRKIIDIFSNVFISLPSLLVSLVVIASLGKNFMTFLFAIMITDWALAYEIIIARLVTIESSGFVNSSKRMGATSSFVIKRHLIPEIKETLKILIETGMPSVIMTIAIFSYFGLDFGTEFFGPGLGEQISFSRDYVFQAPLTIISPMLGIFLLLNFFSRKKI